MANTHNPKKSTTDYTDDTDGEKYVMSHISAIRVIRGYILIHTCPNIS
jgi:hypothetical protein